MERFISAFLMLVLLSLISCDETIQPGGKHVGISEKYGLGQAIKLLGDEGIYPFYITSTDSTKQEFICLYNEAGDTSKKHDAYFFSDTLVRIYVAKVRIGDQIKMEQKKVVLEAEWSYCHVDSNIEVVTVSNKQMLYLATRTAAMGNAILDRDVSFNLIDISSLDQYALQFTGVESHKCDDCLEGKLMNEKELNETPEILAFLKKKFESSNDIYHPTEADKDPYNVINYEDKWDRENNADNHMAAGHGQLQTPVKTTYYTTDLFSYTQGSDFDSVENEQYKFKSFFKGSVIGFDKSKKRWFPLMIESCVDFCSKNIALANDTLTISYDDNEAYKVPLHALIFDVNAGK